ncbi:hypothetical protein LL033_04325 [Clostridium estertheticum]|uniref:hypothetical protein n=1 Tax=Clostridium estertheticum TaxID=238834 RepID=UPI001C0D4741|nr:hypothetical protein [Clostridium estertheticum]MBU3214491.1 hypothetical protein [Clostridium estertheticum]WAG56476.1 hypothetical protein LL033_04325 [Clostridium estertheticum]
MGKIENCSKCSCDLCSVINADPADMEKHGARLLTVRIRVNNVCFDKKVAVAVIIYDNCHRILAFRGFITVVCKENECRDECGTIVRKLVFVLPDDDSSDPDEIEVRTAANYIYPCESNC